MCARPFSIYSGVTIATVVVRKPVDIEQAASVIAHFNRHQKSNPQRPISPKSPPKPRCRRGSVSESCRSRAIRPCCNDDEQHRRQRGQWNEFRQRSRHQQNADQGECVNGRATGVLPPDRMLVAVQAMAPVADISPNKWTPARFASPCD